MKCTSLRTVHTSPLLIKTEFFMWCGHRERSYEKWMLLNRAQTVVRLLIACSGTEMAFEAESNEGGTEGLIVDMMQKTVAQHCNPNATGTHPHLHLLASMYSPYTH